MEEYVDRGSMEMRRRRRRKRGRRREAKNYRGKWWKSVSSRVIAFERDEENHPK